MINDRDKIQFRLALNLRTQIGKMKSLIGKLSVGSAVIGLAMVAAPAAEAFQITTETRGTYDVEIVFGSWEDNPELTSTDWFGDVDLAFEIATAVRDDFVAFENSQAWSCESCAAPLGRSDNGASIRSFVARLNNTAPTFPPSNVNFNSIQDGGTSNSGLYWLIGKKVEVVPSPAAVLPGLLGMGLSAIRKHRGTSSEDV